MDNRILILTLPLVFLATALSAECSTIVDVNSLLWEVEPSALSLYVPNGSTNLEHDFVLLSGPGFDIAVPEKSISVNLPPGIALIADRLLLTDADADYLGVIATMPIAQVKTRLKTGVLVGFPLPGSGGPDPGVRATETATLLSVGGGLMLLAVYRRCRQK